MRKAANCELVLLVCFIRSAWQCQYYRALQIGILGVNNREQLVIVQEIEHHYQNVNHEQIIANIRHAVVRKHGLQTYAVVLLKMGSIFNTFSG